GSLDALVQRVRIIGELLERHIAIIVNGDLVNKAILERGGFRRRRGSGKRRAALVGDRAIQGEAAAAKIAHLSDIEIEIVIRVIEGGCVIGKIRRDSAWHGSWRDRGRWAYISIAARAVRQSSVRPDHDGKRRLGRQIP